MCKLIVNLQVATGQTRSLTSKMQLGKSSQLNSLGLSVQACITAMVARQTCDVGQWSSQVDSTPESWKAWTGHLKEAADEVMYKEDQAQIDGATSLPA